MCKYIFSGLYFSLLYSIRPYTLQWLSIFALLMFLVINSENYNTNMYLFESDNQLFGWTAFFYEISRLLSRANYAQRIKQYVIDLRQFQDIIFDSSLRINSALFMIKILTWERRNHSKHFIVCIIFLQSYLVTCILRNMLKRILHYFSLNIWIWIC